MSRIRIMTGFGVLLLALSQVSCASVVSQSPLSDPDDAKVDERLFGQWKTDKEAKIFGGSYWFIGRPYATDLKNAPAGLMVARGISISRQNELSSDDGPLYFFVSKIGENQYANLVRNDPKKKLAEWDKDDSRIYDIWKYTATEKKLTIWWVDPDLAAKAVAAGKIKGEVKKRPDKNGKETDKVDKVTLMDTIAKTAKFIDGANPTIFTNEPLVLDRVK
jgi:hypothetical protein